MAYQDNADSVSNRAGAGGAGHAGERQERAEQRPGGCFRSCLVSMGAIGAVVILGCAVAIEVLINSGSNSPDIPAPLLSVKLARPPRVSGRLVRVSGTVTNNGGPTFGPGPNGASRPFDVDVATHDFSTGLELTTIDPHHPSDEVTYGTMNGQTYPPVTVQSLGSMGTKESKHFNVQFMIPAGDAVAGSTVQFAVRPVTMEPIYSSGIESGYQQQFGTGPTIDCSTNDQRVSCTEDIAR